MNEQETVTDTIPSDTPIVWEVGIPGPSDGYEEFESTVGEVLAELGELAPGPWKPEKFYRDGTAGPCFRFVSESGVRVDKRSARTSWSVVWRGCELVGPKGQKPDWAKSPAIALRMAIAKTKAKLREHSSTLDALTVTAGSSDMSLASIGDRLFTQDGQGLDRPLFVVEAMLSSGGAFAEIHDDGTTTPVEPATGLALSLLLRQGDTKAVGDGRFTAPDGKTYGFTADQAAWRVLQAFLTEQAAEEWVVRNGQRYPEGVRVNVMATVDNPEMVRVQQLLRVCGP